MARCIGQQHELADILGEIELLKEEMHDLRILHENTVDHSTTIENALEEKNRHINNLITSMKMYLSSQLYNSIIQGTMDTKLSYKRKKLAERNSIYISETTVCQRCMHKRTGVARYPDNGSAEG